MFFRIKWRGVAFEAAAAFGKPTLLLRFNALSQLPGLYA